MLCVIRVVNYPLASLSIFYAFVQEVICQAAHDGMIMGILDKINGQIFNCSRLFLKISFILLNFKAERFKLQISFLIAVRDKFTVTL